MLEIIQGDVCSLASTILILVLLGKVFADQWQKWFGGFIALSAFIAYVVFVWSRTPPKSAEALFNLTFCALVLFGLTLGACWVTLPLLFGLLRPIKHGFIGTSDAMERATREWEQEQVKIAQRRREQEARRREGPERERQRKEAERAANEYRSEQKRREDSRAAVEILYQLHHETLGKKLDKATLEAWIAKYMNDNLSADDVAKREKQFSDLVTKVLQKLETPTTGPSADVLAARAEVETTYQECPEIHRVFPLRQLKAEIRVRIPDDATRAAAWKEARDIMKEILDLAAQEEQKKKQAKSKPINPPLGNV